MADNNMFGGQVGQQQYQQQSYQIGTTPNPYGTNMVNPYGYQNLQPNYWQQQPQQQVQQPIKQDDVREYILLDGSAPNKKRKYVFVGEVDMQTNVVNPLPSFSLEDIRKIVSHEFDVRFGEEKKS